MRSKAWIALSACLAVAAPSSAEHIVGVTWDGDAVWIDPSIPEGGLIGPTGLDCLNSLARDSTGRLVTASAAQCGTPRLSEVDAATGDATTFHAPFLNDIRALAFDPNNDNVLYATDGTTGKFYWLDLTVPYGHSGIKHLIGTLEYHGIHGLTFAEDGTCYGWSTSAGLIIIDPHLAESVDVNGEWDGSSEIQTLAFSSQGVLYGAHDSLYTIDTATGELTLIGSGDWGEVRGMAFVEDAVEGDVNGDGVVNVEDLLELLASWGPCPQPPDECPADLDGNGVVNTGDLLNLLANWS